MKIKSRKNFLLFIFIVLIVLLDLIPEAGVKITSHAWSPDQRAVKIAAKRIIRADDHVLLHEIGEIFAAGIYFKSAFLPAFAYLCIHLDKGFGVSFRNRDAAF